MRDDRAHLSIIAEGIRPLCAHVSIRDDESTPYLFAVGLRHIHSLELRRKGKALVLERWRGPQHKDEFIGEERPSSFEEALVFCEQWLRNDAS